MTQKEEIRKATLRKRRGVTEREHKDNSLLICENIIMMPQIKEANTVMLYAPMKDEADVWLLIDGLLERGKCVVLPFVCDGQMQVAEYCVDDILTSDRYGILEPDPQYAQPPEQIDVAIVPGVAFCKDGTRLGMGGGMYDRFLQDLDCLKIGVCFEWQLVPQLPKEPHDVPMDAIVTELHLILCHEEQDGTGGNDPA